MNVGDKFWVSDFYTNQDDYLVEFEVVHIDVPINSGHTTGAIYKCIRPDAPFRRPHYFTNNGSVDVMSAKIYKTEEEVRQWELEREDYERRREEAMRIFPEGFDV